MKLSLILTSLFAAALPSCVLVTDTMLLSVASDMKKPDYKSVAGATFKADSWNQSKSFIKAADTVKAMFNSYLTSAGLKYAMGKYYDFKGSELNSAQTVRLEELRNAKSVEDAKAALETLKATQAAEAAAASIPAT